MINPCKKSQAFSLVELLVTISIIAVMAVSTTVGFRYLGDTLRTKQAAGVITDTIKRLELELLQNEYEKSRIYFATDYLVVVSEVEGSTLVLTWNQVDTDNNCPEIGIGSDGNLTKSNEDSEIIAVSTVSAETEVCQDFNGSSDREWNYQIMSGSEESDIIRLIHFNVNRENPSGITIDSNTVTLEISAPYAKKRFYDENGDLISSLSINILSSDEERTEELTIR